MKYNKVAFLFPGQGAQYPGMGKDFYESFSEARELLQEANELLGRDLLSILFKGPAEALTETHNSQAGIYLVSMAILATLRKQFPDLQPRQHGRVDPDHGAAADTDESRQHAARGHEHVVADLALVGDNGVAVECAVVSDAHARLNHRALVYD